MPYILSQINESKQAVILISFIAVVSAVDSQFITIFYGTKFGTPGNLHLLLFTSFIVVTFIIITLLLRYAKSNVTQASLGRTLLFKVAYVGTYAVQYTISFIALIMILEMIIFNEYNKILSLLVIYLSHSSAAIVLGVLYITFIHWFRSTRSFSILIYGIVFIVIIFLIVVTILLLTEQFTNQSPSIFPRPYTSLILNVIVPSRNVAFIFGFGSYVLPVMIISSWILTVSLLKSYANRIGKKTFWFLVGIPLLYQLLLFITRDTTLITDPVLIQIIYSKQFQFLFGIRYEISGLFFSIAFLIIGRKMKRKSMKSYLIISSIGMMSLFTSMQPGLPFYAAYPPFGLVTLFFLGLSSFLLLVGILGCAAYVSRDRELRREIYKGLEVNSDMLNKMGIAEMQREMERRILPIVDKVKLSDEMRERIDPDPEDVKNMIYEVLNEIHSKKPDNNLEDG